MIAADASALLSLATVDLLDTVLTEFDVHTTETVVEELNTTGEYDDRHGDAAETVLSNRDRITVHQVGGEFTSSRVDQGEGTCALLTEEIDTAFLVTDGLRALPELQTVVDAQVAISPVVLKALVTGDVLERAEALDRLDELADQRDWLGAPIYRRAEDLFAE